MLDLPPNFGLRRLRGALGKFNGRKSAVDIGAHKGIWTKVMMGEFERVYSFEPVKENFDVLKEINFCSYQIALGDKAGSGGMIPGENTGMWHLTKDINSMGTNIEMLDSYNLTEIDFIKIDVEGYELHVLEGAKVTVNKYKPAILLEENGLCDRYGVTREDIWSYMGAIGYSNVANWQGDYLFINGH